MRRLYSRLSRRTWLTLAAATAIVAAWLCYAGLGATRTPAPIALPEVALPTTVSEYTVHNGKVLDGDATTSETGASDTTGKVDALDIRKAYERAKGLFAQTQGKVFKATLTPHWFDGAKRFWYRNDLKGGAREFILVDAVAGKRAAAFDHKKLAAALSKAASKDYAADRLPFDSIEFPVDAKAVRFRVAGVTWQCDLASYECQRSSKEVKEEESEETSREGATREASESSPWAGETDAAPSDEEDAPQPKKKGGFKKGPIAKREAASPDGKWTALVKDSNVYLRDKDEKETQITTVGTAANPFAALIWAPDSKSLVMFRTEPGDNKEVYMIETSPKDQLAAKLHTRPYPRPGDKFNLHEIHVVDIETKKSAKADVERVDYGGVPRLRWSKDNKTFTFEKIDRGHQRFRIVEVDARSGATRNIVDEKAETFIWTAHAPKFDEIPGVWTHYLDDTGEIIYASERDGWKHLYLIDARTGAVKNQITRGAWAIRGVDQVDAKARQIWFRGNGRNHGQDPYFVHYYRVNFDGSGLVALTEGDGDHYRPKAGLAFSPDKKHFIDTYSRVDMPPVHELRRVSDGSLVCKLEQADVSALEATGWRAPEVFVAKGRDGKTDIWGIVCRPQKHDPKKKYPVIEYIYAGPHGSFTPKSFAAYRNMMALAELGFIVVQCDGMGTAHRSRAFHDVCWKNIADAGFPDRIAWMKALAAKYAYVDVSRVGIYGTSAGGQSSTGALLFHPEFYKVAVSSCGCHDNRLDKFSWNEQWMGLMGAHYEAQSNVTNAHKLQGKLLLIVGELDTNVPPESTMRVVDALIRARKDFDLIVVPGMNHSDGGPYGERRRWDYFVRHLHGVEPPDRNAVK
ncbi:MAG: prolyl oligopeptidase family serine peptidase [Gemmataceae bacterium]